MSQQIPTVFSLSGEHTKTHPRAKSESIFSLERFPRHLQSHIVARPLQSSSESPSWGSHCIESSSVTSRPWVVGGYDPRVQVQDAMLLWSNEAVLGILHVVKNESLPKMATTERDDTFQRAGSDAD